MGTPSASSGQLARSVSFADLCKPLRALRPQTLLCACIILLAMAGTATRLRHYLAAPSFWFDETALISNVLDCGYGELLGPLANQQAAPPLYLWMLRWLHETFGASEWSMRLPALVGGIAMVWLAWPWGRQSLRGPGIVCLVGLAAISLHGLQHADEVKPYALDAMWTIVILGLGARAFAEPRFSSLLGLIALGMLGPWASFPAVFALGGVGVAWIIETFRRRDRTLGIGLAVYGVCGLASCALFWLLVGRHQHTPGLTTWWSSAFWDFSSPLAAILWLGNCFRNMADYATTGMGIPFLLLAPLGIWALARRAPLTVWMIAATFAFALIANALRKYPLDGRVSYFLAPLTWLVIASAFDECHERLEGAWKWLPTLVLLALCASDVARTANTMREVHANGDFHEAMEFVHQNWRDGDSIWQFSPGVYEVYYGKERLKATTHLDWRKIPSGTQGHRLWMIGLPEMVLEREITWTQLQTHAEATGWRKSEQHPFYGLEVVLFTPSVDLPPDSVR